MPAKPKSDRDRRKYEFIDAHRKQFPVEVMCWELGVAPSGYYAWLKCPLSKRAVEDARLLRLVRASFTARQGIFRAPRVFLDLREAGQTCSKHRVARLMRENGLRALHGYRTRRWEVGKPAVLTPNLLERQFDPTQPDMAWATDITYIGTWQGWLYLAVVIDLFSRKVVGWAAGPTIHRELVLNALATAVKQRRPRGTISHSDQGVRYGSDAWRRFCRSNRLEPSVSRKGNWSDNAVAEAFFSSLKKERIKKRIYPTRDAALADIAEYIDQFYNPTRAAQPCGRSQPRSIRRRPPAPAAPQSRLGDTARSPQKAGNSNRRYFPIQGRMRQPDLMPHPPVRPRALDVEVTPDANPVALANRARVLRGHPNGVHHRVRARGEHLE